MKYHIYIIYSNFLDRFYVGYSQNPWTRLEQHNTNCKDKYTGRSQDWVLKVVFEAGSESNAIRLERFIKRQKSRVLIEKLCDEEFLVTGVLAQLVRVPHVRD